MSGFQLQRLGMIMEPEPGNAQEAEGTLNPGAIRGPDGELYLFPRLVARGNYSRIGIARVRFNGAGDPCGVERLGIALEPEADYERRPDGGGGCEDPRITYLEPLKRYVMMYAAFSAIGPRIAVAISENLLHWTRLGLATFEPYDGIDFVNVDNKDASLFPVTIPNHAGEKCSWPSSIAPYSEAPVPRKPPPSRLRAWWIAPMKASGFRTRRWHQESSSRRVSDYSILITGSRLRWHPGKH